MKFVYCEIGTAYLRIMWYISGNRGDPVSVPGKSTCRRCPSAVNDINRDSGIFSRTCVLVNAILGIDMFTVLRCTSVTDVSCAL
jgi:hypothetical protein